ncbi:DNA replication complex subunit Gins51 [Halolamina sp. C58]|uniref:DNA replication complex subunit Gins51 n=1 Tax=Halolamina sp. C58 TaxID=3421640 RepID=UPI003EB90EAB
MDIDELQTVQSKERQKDSLQHLRDSFYEDVAAYIEELKQERDRVAEEADEPFSNPEVSRLSDDIERAEDVVEAIYERRVGKVVKMASFAAADMPVEEEGLTTQERDLFEDMVGRIGENRSRVLDILAGEGDSVPASAGAPGAQPEPTETTETSEPTAPGGETPTRTDDTGPSRDEPAVGTGAPDPTAPSSTDESDDVPPAPPDRPASEAEAAGSEPPEASVDPRSDGGVATASGDDAPASADTAATGAATEKAADDRTTVRVTEDVGRMLGVDDREYELESEDVVSLPADNAEALLQREAAERLW